MLIGGFRSRLASRGRGTRPSRGRRDHAATGRQFRTTFVPLAAMIAPSALPEVKVGRVDGHGTGENRNHDSHQPRKEEPQFFRVAAQSAALSVENFRRCKRQRIQDVINFIVTEPTKYACCKLFWLLARVAGMTESERVVLLERPSRTNKSSHCRRHSMMADHYHAVSGKRRTLHQTR